MSGAAGIAVATLVVLVAGDAYAQTTAGSGAPAIACDECVRGQLLLQQMSEDGAALVAAKTQLVALFVSLRLEMRSYNGEQESAIRLFISQQPPRQQRAFLALLARRDDQLLDIGFSLCASPDPECAKYVAAGLRAASDVANEGVVTPERYGLPHEPTTCDPYVVTTTSPRSGVGFEFGEGWQDSARPTDGRIYSLGLEARARLRDKLGLVVRVDRSAGRDESTDDDGDGHDDEQTGDVTRWTLLAGPTLRFHTTEKHDEARYWQVDVLGGVLGSGDQSGLVMAYDVSYQLVVARLGVRTMIGFGDASDERAILLHTGFMFGAGPQFSHGAGCGRTNETVGATSWALALDTPISGWAQGLGYVAPGFGLAGAYRLHELFAALVSADLLVMPAGDRERSLHHTGLVGGRLDLSSYEPHGVDDGPFATAAAGYDMVSAPSSSPIQSGFVGEVSLGWIWQESDGAMWLRLHGRQGLGPDNNELRTVFVSGGLELRIHRSSWRRRD